MTDIEKLSKELTARVAEAADPDALEAVRVQALGKKGQVTELLKGLGAMSAEERQSAGTALYRLMYDIGQAIEAQKAALELSALEARMADEKLDVTLPVRAEEQGAIHPLSQVWEEIIAIFADMGFSLAEGPDIETDYYNFTALNFPPDHPAREMQDTFFFPADEAGEAKVLRTHTSPVQIRTMQSQKPPIRIIVPGRTYRCDSDATHTPMFHQIEGLVIDKSTHMGHLKGCVEEFVRAFFEVDHVEMRFRNGYFPFTEPSAEVDIRCSFEGNELKIGEGDQWLEILGSGMVHPRVLENCGLDPNVYQGYAFGMGLDRLAMLKYGIPDLRDMFESDLRWLRHYGFSALDVPSLAGGLSR